MIQWRSFGYISGIYCILDDGIIPNFGSEIPVHY